MKKYIIGALGATLLLSGCTISENLCDEINPRPTLILGYRYINKDQQNTLAREVQKMDVFVFDGQGRYVATVEASNDELTSAEGLTILSGVPADIYTVVSFGNIERARLPVLIPGHSTLDDLRVTCEQNDLDGMDLLFHSIRRQAVGRGKPVIRPECLEKMFFRIDLKVTGLDFLNPQGEVDVEIGGIAAGFDAEGRPLPSETTVRPELRREGDTLRSVFAVSRFDDRNCIGILLRAQDRPVIDIPLSDYLEQKEIGIDFQNDRDIVIPVQLDVSSAEVTVRINGWETGAVQFSGLGE